MSDVKMTEKDARRLNAMEHAIRKDPKTAAEFLTYAYGLGYCQGREVTAKEMIAVIDSHQPPAAGGTP